MSGVHATTHGCEPTPGVQKRNEPGPEGPASSVLPPATALGLLLSRALSSERAVQPYCNPRASQTRKAQSHPDARNALNLGGLGAEPPNGRLGVRAARSSSRNIRRTDPRHAP